MTRVSDSNNYSLISISDRNISYLYQNFYDEVTL